MTIIPLGRLSDFIKSLKASADAPCAQDLADAPTLSDWALVSHEKGILTLTGITADHPSLSTQADTVLQTSPIVAIDIHRTWARTASRWYRLQDGYTNKALSISTLLGGTVEPLWIDSRVAIFRAALERDIDSLDISRHPAH